MSTEMSEAQAEMQQNATEQDVAAAVVDDEDLEDGEIDDSDEEGSKTAQDVAGPPKVSTDLPEHGASEIPTTNKSNKSLDTDKLHSDVATNHHQSSKSKKPQPVEDDFVGSIEHAIANALKKKGIEPTMPKILESKLQQQYNDNSDESGTPGPGQGQSKSSRRRKRKKQREEKEKKEEKEKDRTEKRKRFDASDPLGPPPLGDEMDMDEFEMMNVRGGSPPPLSALPPPPPMRMYDEYDSRDDSASSYDSYESNDSNGDRRKRRSKKESRRRKDKRSEDKRSEKRSRRESLDEKHRNEPRKLELCKFYLMECCAKRDKCSYMHAEFPCKYYYLGMECTTKDDCKFSHGEPLTEELRNILLKHLESAPKEILGNFKRMSRENALNMVVKRHEELCRKFNAQNIWAPVTANTLPISNNRRNNNISNNIHKKDNDMQPHNSNIPSLLDLVVNPPQNMEPSMANKSGSNETKRKSRWTDNSNSGSSGSSSNIQPPSKTAPSYLDLKNLTGILSAEHIEKLSQMGIVNLEQVNQLTFGQLNQIGLTIAEITEIQLNAINMAKLGVTGGQKLPKPLTTKGSSSAKGQDVCSKTSSNGDVDMRFIAAESASGSPTTTTAATNSVATLELPEKDNTNSSNSNSSSGVVMVDYSQYLKDSNISFEKGDLYDDEKDDEQLVIDDDDNLETEEQPQKSIATDSVSSETVEKHTTELFDNEFALKLSKNMSDISKTFRNPFKTASFYGAETKTSGTEDASFSGNIKSEFKSEFVEESIEDFYLKRRRSRESRSHSKTPPESQSNTPEASQSPQPFDSLREESSPVKDVVYERSTIYDLNSADVGSDDKRSSRLKSDKDMRFFPGSLMSESSSSDIDLRLPFQPMTNYTPASEIDGSITSHLPINYKVYLVDVPRPSYAELRQQFKSDTTKDPRLRRILGLTELSPSKTSTALSRKVRKSSSNSIASPSETEDSSPRYYTPSSTEEKPRPSRADPRADPRDSRSSNPRVNDPRQSESRSTDPRQSSDPRRSDPRSAKLANASSSSSINSLPTNPSGGQKQNVEIRNLLQKSDWYKNLNSKFKIMVNQQLALVSTELKKFHQDQSPNKLFDISFIVNNQTLQQILTNLGIYIDDNGEVAHLEGDSDDSTSGTSQSQDASGDVKPSITLPNLSLPPPNAAANQRNPNNNTSMDFLMAPPPNMVPQGPPPIALGPMFQRPNIQVPLFARPSLLGLPPGQGNPMNPFNSPMPNMNVNINPNFLAGAPSGMLGPFGGGPNFGPGPNMPLQQQRNFSNNQRNNNRNQNKRRI